MQEPGVFTQAPAAELPKQPDPEKVMILVGFGKKDLSELVGMINSGKEEEAFKATLNVPARWRRLKICETQDIDNMRVFTEFLARKLGSRFPGL